MSLVMTMLDASLREREALMARVDRLASDLSEVRAEAQRHLDLIVEATKALGPYYCAADGLVGNIQWLRHHYTQEKQVSQRQLEELFDAGDVTAELDGARGRVKYLEEVLGITTRYLTNVLADPSLVA